MEGGPINEGDGAASAVPVVGGNDTSLDYFPSSMGAGQGHDRHTLGHPYGSTAEINNFDHADYHHEEK